MTKTLHENIKPDTPSPAGESIERLLVWAYRMQLAHIMAANYATGPGGVVSQLGSFTALGTRVDSSGARAGSGRLHEDALTLHETVRSLDAYLAGLIMMHAQAATRPDVRPGARHRMDADEWRIEERYPGSHSGEYLRVPVIGWIKSPEGTGPMIFIREVDRPAEVNADREIYREWRAALIEVRSLVLGKLASHRVSDELPPEAPADMPPPPPIDPLPPPVDKK
ncbi:hypothetical protein sos41_11750 [Alphaproteobacteria bacterium SO-S41]|nr:hypothetical protein sos41_11750 [Alphaproteobacteria bacterium SO-S41]